MREVNLVRSVPVDIENNLCARSTRLVFGEAEGVSVTSRRLACG